MRILLLSFEYPPETGFGGIGTYTWYQARGLVKLGHEVHVLGGATGPAPMHENGHDGVRVFRLRLGDGWMKLLRRLEKHRLWWTKNRLENGHCMHAGFRSLRARFDYDIVEMPECGAEGLRIVGRTDVPTLIKLHSPAKLIMGTYDVRRADHLLCGFVEKIAMRRVDAMTSCSRFVAQEVKKKLGLKRHIEVISNGIDLQRFDAQPQVDARDRFGIPKDRPMIFFAGRLEPRKGIHTMKDVAAAVLKKHKAAFVFAGQDLFQYAEREMKPFLAAQPLQGSVHFLGKLDLEEVGSCLRQTDVFVIPSLWENCPYACLEAMAAARAIVASDAGGLPELIRDGDNGLVVKVEDVAGFCVAIERLLEDPALRERLGRAARRAVEASYTAGKIAAKSAAFYEVAIRGGA